MCKRILLIATGGTIAARETENGLAPQLRAEALLDFVPEIQTLCRVTVIQLCELDSTDITPDIWLKITDCIEQNYAQCRGICKCQFSVSRRNDGRRNPKCFAGAKKNKEQSKVLSRIKHARCRVYLHTGCFGKHFACRGRNLRRFDFGILWLGRCACVFG